MRLRGYLATAVAATVVAVAAVLAAPGQAATSATPLWTANTGLGTKAFEGVEEAPGTITVANDPLGKYGASFRYETWANSDGSKARSESRGMRGSNGSVYLLNSSKVGQTFYLGWRALWDPMPTQSGAWIALFQMHVDGVSGSQPNVGPFVLRTLGDGKLHFQLVLPNGSSKDIWVGSLTLNAWQTFTIGFKLSRTSTGSGAGWVSFWHNGTEQKLTNGSMQYAATTLWGDHDNVKWGVYRSGSNHTGHAVAWMNDGKLASTYAAAAP